MTVLITCAAATWFMAGLHWFVQVVHYPLFADVGTERFIAYHAWTPLGEWDGTDLGRYAPAY